MNWLKGILGGSATRKTKDEMNDSEASANREPAVEPAHSTPVSTPVTTPSAAEAELPDEQTQQHWRDAIVAGATALGDGDNALARRVLGEFLQSPGLPPNVLGDALGLFGTSQQYGANGDKQLARVSLEKALALGKTARLGFDDMSDMRGLYADTLAENYEVDALIRIGEVKTGASETEMRERLALVKTLLGKLDSLITIYGSVGGFETVQHKGFALFIEGQLAACTNHFDDARQRMEQFLSPPYRDTFESGKWRFLVGGAYRQIGLVWFKGLRVPEKAIPHFQDALRYFEQGDEDFNGTKSLLEEAQSHPAVQFASGWNGLPWGTPLTDFQRRFSEATIDGPCWVTGEGEERFLRIRIPVTKYMFNTKGQFYLVAFYTADEVNLLDGDYASHLLGTLGNPDGAVGTSWTYGKVVLKVTESCLILVNTAFDDDPRSWEVWTGKKR